MPKKTLKFATAADRQDHFRRHGAAVRAFTPSQYEVFARRFLSASPGAGVLEKTRPNGDRIRYNQASEEFAIVTSSGIIKTYFLPDPAVHGYRSNRDYYNAQ